MNSSSAHEIYDLAVIGGGLAGLYAAAKAAREGLSVVLLEAGPALGGRAKSPEVSEAVVANLGPRGLYRGGYAQRALRRLGVESRGKRPPSTGSFRLDGAISPFPALAAMAVPMFAGAGPIDAPVLRSVRRAVISARSEGKAAEDGRTVGQWLDAKDVHETARVFVGAMIRLTTYVADVESLPSPLACRQLSDGLSAGVCYVDGGWASLVAGLEVVARKAGVRIETDAAVDGLEREDGVVCVQTANASLRAHTVIVTLPPGRASRLVGAAVLPSDAVAVRTACLDLVLQPHTAPRGARALGLGFNEPLYFSVHSQTPDRSGADFGPGVVAHAMLGLTPDDARTPAQRRRVLETFVDEMAPGARQSALGERFLPSMTVAHCQPALPEHRPAVATQPMPGVFLAGDYLRTRAWLLDGCLESVDAALAAIRRQRVEAA